MAFPSSPNIGDTYAVYGRTYVFDGTKWNGDVPEVIISSNDNLIVNGNFDIWQRGTTFTNQSGFSADHWTSSTYSQTTSRISVGTAVPGSSYALRTILTSGGNTTLQQPIELSGTGTAGLFVAGETFVLSFYAKLDVAGQVGMSFVGRDASNIGTNAISMAPTTLLPATTSWEKFVIPFTVTNAPNPTNTCVMLIIRCDFGQQLDITQLKLEIGTEASAFQPKLIADELAACQRYYETGREYSSRVGNAAMTNEIYVPYKVTKRTNAALSFPYMPTGGGTNVTAHQFLNSYLDGFRTQWQATTGGVDAAPYLTYIADAEL